MSGQPIGIFAMKIEPGKVHRLALLEDLHLTSVSYDEELPLDAPNSRSSLRLHCFPANGAIKDGEEDDEEEEEEDEEEEDEHREEQTFVLASLSTKGSLHSSLSVDFARDEEIGFSITGNHPVDLVGSYIYASPEDEGGNSELDSDEYDLSPDSDEYDSEDMEGAEEAYAKLLEEGGLDSEDDDEEDEERFQELEDSEASKPKKKLVTAKAAADAVNGKKRSREDQDENGDVSMASSTNGVGASETDAELLAAGVKPSELEGLSRNQRKRLNKKLKGVDGEAAEPDVASEKPVKKEVKKVEIVEKKEPKKEAKKEVKKSSKVTLPSGTIIEDKKLAAGGASTRAAKAGDRVGMRYVGKLLKNGKEFDSNTKGKPFSFKLGRGEVIKGWDEGVKGMRVGDERRLTLPPQVAYGSQKIAGIPPNSTLVFDIKLVEIK